MNRLQFAIDSIVFARNYTVRLLETIDPSDWFRMPPEGITHVAWQVGHLAMAEYRLALERLRGAQPDDPNLISTEFLRIFGRDSVVERDPTKYPSIVEIRSVFDRVHQQTLRELQAYPGNDLDSPPMKAHALCETKIEVLRWCGHHEMIHTGQIGLLRRFFGAKPMW
jgi:hypothetical protein